VLILGIGGLAVWSMQKTRHMREQSIGERLPLGDRGMLGPLKRLATDLEELVAKNRDSAAVQVLGKEAVADAQAILRRAEAMLLTRHELKRTLRSRYETEKAIEELKLRIAHAQGREKTTLESALAARHLEVQHYAQAEEVISRIDADLKQAEAALSEIKTRLSLLGSQDRAKAEGAADDFREALTRVRAIGESFEETQQLLN
jgi:hypothetical protein